MALTEEQMDIDLMNYRLDHPEKFTEMFIDEGFAAFEQETTSGEEDEIAPVEAEIASEVDNVPVVASEAPKDGWEDVPDEDL